MTRESNRKTTIKSILLGLTLVAFGAACTAGGLWSTTPAEDCAVVIVGGGAAGVYTAYRLAEEHVSGVCLFEKESRLGGRIYDVENLGGMGSGRVDVGARRIKEGQVMVTDLAKELRIEFTDKVESHRDLFIVRGVRSFSKDEIAQRYPDLKKYDTSEFTTSDVEDALFAKLRSRDRLEAGLEFPSYVRKAVGDEGFDYLWDTARFRGDYAYPMDAKGYLDWLDYDWDLGAELYPKGGMSEFIRRMARRASGGGVRLFLNEKVERVESVPSGFKITTAKRKVHPGSVILAVSANGLSQIGGDVVERITNSSEFESLVGVRVVTITQWWPEAWWSVAANDGRPFDRLITTESCLGYMEAPLDSDSRVQKVTRTVYSDDPKCVKEWEELYRQSKKEVVERLQSLLQASFPAAQIPRPINTHVQIWPAAWYWIAAGTNFSNEDIADWAVKPLGDENVSLVGESYNPAFSTWSEAAYQSAARGLDRLFEISRSSREAPTPQD